LQIILDKFAEGCLFPVLMIDSKGFIRSINNETMMLFGYNRWELIGQKINLLMPDGIAKRHDHYMRRYEATKQRRIVMERRDRISGKVLFSLSVTLFYGSYCIPCTHLRLWRSLL
jgi:PAS domain S-box-containing protein